MSDILTHGYCAFNALENLKNQNTKKLIHENITYYYLGSQGPDIFYYYHVWPWTDGKAVNHLASILHKSNTQLFLMESYNYILEISSPKDKEIMLAYFYGFLSHYALDQISHPFIFYFSGVTDPKNKATFHFKYDHKLFECTLDTLLRNHYLSSNQHIKTQHEIIKIASPISPTFDDYFQYIFKKVYQMNIVKGCASHAAKDMYKVVRFLYDPLNIKRPFIVFFENLLKKPLAFSTALFPVPLKDHLDYMNTNNKTWLHPCDETIKSSASFIELFDQATLLTARYIDSFDHYNHGKLTLAELKNVIENNAYDTGQSSECIAPMKYYDSIYKNK